MMMMMEGLIWQPKFGSDYNFDVYLDRAFAREMRRVSVPEDVRRNMNKRASEELKLMGSGHLDPYSFQDNSCLINQVYLGDDGKWLSTDHQTLDRLLKEEDMSKPLEYSSHNLRTSRDASMLLRLFGLWADYATTMSNIK